VEKDPQLVKKARENLKVWVEEAESMKAELLEIQKNSNKTNQILPKDHVLIQSKEQVESLAETIPHLNNKE
jgi:hypothetical protein